MTFSIKRLGPGLWLIHEPWFSERANLYLLQGSRGRLLIDAGVGLADLNAWLESRTLSPDMVAITHAHFDHCGGLHQFAVRSVLLTPCQASNIKDPGLWGLPYLKQADFSSDGGSTVSIDEYGPESPGAWRILGASIGLGDRQLSVIHLPGHTDDSVAFFDEHRGWLFTGDTLYRGKLYSDFPNSDLEKWEDSLRKISELKPNLVLPGHDEPIDSSSLQDAIQASIGQLA